MPSRLWKGREKMETYAKLDSYLGAYPTEEALNSHSTWIKLARNIRKQLGKRAALLDEYLTHVFRGLHSIMLPMAMVEGSRHAESLRKLCTEIAESDNAEELQQTQHYAGIKHTLDKYSESTPKELLVELCLAELLPYHLPDSMHVYRHDAASDVIVEAQTRKIMRLIRELTAAMKEPELLAELNHAIGMRFQMVIPMECYIQGVDNILLEALLKQDKKGKHVFQYLLDREVEE